MFDHPGWTEESQLGQQLVQSITDSGIGPDGNGALGESTKERVARTRGVDHSRSTRGVGLVICGEPNKYYRLRNWPRRKWYAGNQGRKGW
jgi:hypothetical protein